MEIAVSPDVPSYAGGLGILAGDTIRSAADLRVPMVAVTLLARKGYFHQRLDSSGQQIEEPEVWDVSQLLRETEAVASVEISGRAVTIRAWRYDVASSAGFTIPVYFIDSDLAGNQSEDRLLTGQLYGGDERYRLCQETLLGIGGVRVLRALGYSSIERFHLNEGHAALLTMELLREAQAHGGRQSSSQIDFAAVKKQCVFTTHTPVPAGHDQFSLDLVGQVLGHHQACCIADTVCSTGQLNMTHLALTLSHYINGVAKKHSEVAQGMFAEYKIDSITNGVHAATWVSPPFAQLFDEHIPGWRTDNFSLRYALSIPDAEIKKAHESAKRTLLSYIRTQNGINLEEGILTLGFGRRAAGYKRAALIFQDIQRLLQICRKVGPIQLIFAGKAHPQDEQGRRVISQIVEYAQQLSTDLPVVYLPNYDIDLCRMMVAGADVWLNTPDPPKEASGTSGMKAALNGTPSLSVLDGWWIEGCLEGVTGWSIGHRNAYLHGANADSLYEKLENSVIPLYYDHQVEFIDIMRHAIALNGSFFNTQRMVQEYLIKSYAISSSSGLE